MLRTAHREKHNCLYLILLIILFFCFFTKFTYCYLSISKNKPKLNYLYYKNLDINNNKENTFKIDLNAFPSKKANSFIELSNHKELYFANFAISNGVKQFLHFHASVRKTKFYLI